MMEFLSCMLKVLTTTLFFTVALEQVAGRPLTVLCKDKQIKLRRPRARLREIATTKMVVDSKFDLDETELSHVPVVEECPIRVDLDIDENRLPRKHIRVTCDKCHLKCKPISVHRTFLHRKCNESIGTVYTLSIKTVVVGYYFNGK